MKFSSKLLSGFVCFLLEADRSTVSYIDSQSLLCKSTVVTCHSSKDLPWEDIKLLTQWAHLRTVAKLVKQERENYI